MQPKITFDTGKDDQANRRFWRLMQRPARTAATAGQSTVMPLGTRELHWLKRISGRLDCV